MEREAKKESDTLKRIDIRSLNQRGLFKGWYQVDVTWAGRGGKNDFSTSVSFLPGRVEISLSYGFQNLSVPLLTTPCYFGGSRYWFACPFTKDSAPCSRRVAVLYLNGERFGCRHCHNLTYASRNAKRYSELYPLTKTLELDRKIEALIPSIKRENYAGKPTKKQHRLAGLQRMFFHHAFSTLEKKV